MGSPVTSSLSHKVIQSTSFGFRDQPLHYILTLYIFRVNDLMLVKVGVRKSSPENIELQLSMEELNISIIGEIILIYYPP
jgi:hypothetical protein